MAVEGFKIFSFSGKIFKMKNLNSIFFYFLLSSPFFLSGSTKFSLIFSYLISSLFLLYYFLKNDLDISFKIPLLFFFLFSLFIFFTVIPLKPFIIKYLSPNLFKLILNLSFKEYYTLSLSPLWTLRNFSFIITSLSIFIFFSIFFKNSKHKIEHFSKMLFSFIFSFSLLSIFLHYSNIKKYFFYDLKEWNLGLFSNENVFGSFCAMGVPLGIYLFFHKLKQKQASPGAPLFYLITSIFLIFFIIIVKALGPLLALILSFILCIIYRKPILGIITFTIFLTFLLFSFSHLPLEVKNSANNRAEFNYLAFNIFLKYPIFGSGLGTTPLISAIYQRPLKEIIIDKFHNDYIELLATAGIISLFFFLSSGFIIYKNLKFLREKYNLRCGLFLSAIVILFHSFLDFPLQNFSIMAYFCLILGVLYAEEKKGIKLSNNYKNILIFFLIFSSTFLLILFYGFLKTKTIGYSLFFPEESFKKIRNEPELGYKFLKYHPFYAPIWGEIGRERERENKFEEAIYAVEKALFLQPTHPNLYLVAAKLYFIKGDMDKYKETLSKAFALSISINLKPFPLSFEEKEEVIINSLDYADKFYGVSAFDFYLKAYENLRSMDSKRTKEIAELIAKKFKNKSIIHYNLANEYLKEGNLSLAKLEAEKSYELEKNIRNSLILAQIYFKEREYEKGKEILFKGISLIKKGEYLKRYFITGAAELKKFNIKDALEFLKIGYFMEPNISYSYYLGLYEEERKNFIEAESWYKKTIEMDPNHQKAYIKLAELYIKIKEKKNLRDLKERCKILFPQESWWEKW